MPNSKQIVYLSQAQYAELIANGTITVDGVTVTYDENDIYVTPQAEPVTDVKVNGTSVVTDGVANVPMASSGKLGVVSVDSMGLDGITVYSNGRISARRALIKAEQIGNSATMLLTPSSISTTTFYGLARAAGDNTLTSSTVVGTYTPAAKAAIQSMLGVSDLIATAEPTLVASKAYAIGDVFTANGKLYKATAAIAANDTIVLQNEGETISGANAVETKVGEGFPHDVQVNGTSVVSNGIAEIPRLGASGSGNYGVCRVNQSFGITQNGDSGYLILSQINDVTVKAGDNQYIALTPRYQHKAVFYGLAKAAGDTTMASSSNAVGTYTDSAKASIKQMLGIVDGSTGTVDVSGAAPSITAVENTRYVCGEVTSLSFTPAANGICIVRFTSGSTATLLTVPNTVKFPEWFDSTSLETNTIYEICVTDGVYGAVMLWAQ